MERWEVAAAVTTAFKRLMTAPGMRGAVISNGETGHPNGNDGYVMCTRRGRGVGGVPADGPDRLGQNRNDNCTSTKL